MNFLSTRKFFSLYARARARIFVLALEREGRIGSAQVVCHIFEAVLVCRCFPNARRLHVATDMQCVYIRPTHNLTKAV